MEFLWYIIAALGAGIGTGLAGLSAATVMVPILIVLCPSFHGETGAYQATAIALASDILGSAVTTYTYAKYKNIDLKRGWIMLTCILAMCTVGSYAAFLAGNVVLGSFTLFLTFFIGIRFLLKPDTSRKEQASRGERLDRRGIAISLFFGLTIGFGTGFVGTGGGMMMLVVFTAFLGMELKTAVGTSTFIMTFTALIASVSHILIHPAILLEKWDVMLLCIVIATAASLLSARFANRVSSRTVGFLCQPCEQPYGRPCYRCSTDPSWSVDAASAFLASDFCFSAGATDPYVFRQADSLYHSLCPDPPADPLSDRSSFLCFPETSPCRRLQLFYCNDAHGRNLAVSCSDIFDPCASDLSAACLF